MYSSGIVNYFEVVRLLLWSRGFHHSLVIRDWSSPKSPTRSSAVCSTLWTTLWLITLENPSSEASKPNTRTQHKKILKLNAPEQVQKCSEHWIIISTVLKRDTRQVYIMNTNKLAFLGAQVFLTGSICRHVNPAAAFSSLSTVANSNHFATIHSPIVAHSNSKGSVTSTSLFSTMGGPTLTNVDKQVCFSPKGCFVGVLYRFC